jgi:hypothetical protein
MTCWSSRLGEQVVNGTTLTQTVRDGWFDPTALHFL